MTADETTTSTPPPKSRLLLGGVVFVSGFLVPLAVPMVALTTLPSGWKTALSGLLLFGIPEVFMLIAVAILGKPGFAYLKALIFGYLGKHLAPPERVGVLRYRIGLVMFALPLLLAFVTPYVGDLIPGYEAHRMWYGLSGDLLLLSSLFALGGEFWDKLRALFIHEATAVLPGPVAQGH
jgi:hypothetical protein